VKKIKAKNEVSGFLWVPLVSSMNKTDCHNITEILLKVALNTIILISVMASI